MMVLPEVCSSGTFVTRLSELFTSERLTLAKRGGGEEVFCTSSSSDTLLDADRHNSGGGVVCSLWNWFLANSNFLQ